MKIPFWKVLYSVNTVVASRKGTHYNRKQDEKRGGFAMEAITCIKNRRSIRKYKEDSIPHELIEEIVDTARFAPSWKNTQTVRYICVEDPVLKQQIADHFTEGSAQKGDIISKAPP